MRQKIIDLLAEVARDYTNREMLVELHEGHDIHAYFHLWGREENYTRPLKTIHVQGYPGMSTENKARVWARLMGFEKILSIRNEGEVSIGNEHKATIQNFPNFEAWIYIPYDSKVLEKMLEENVPELNIKEGD